MLSSNDPNCLYLCNIKHNKLIRLSKKFNKNLKKLIDKRTKQKLYGKIKSKVQKSWKKSEERGNGKTKFQKDRIFRTEMHQSRASFQFRQIFECSE